MPTFNVEPAYFRHIKTVRLKLALAVAEADVYPLRLWAMLTDFDPDNGTCRDLTAAEVEAMLDWKGKPGKLVDTLISVGFLEESPEGRLQAHDWATHEGHLKAYRERAKTAAHRRWGQFPTPQPIQKGPESLNSAHHGPKTRKATPTPPLSLGARAEAAKRSLPDLVRVTIKDLSVLSVWEKSYPDVDLAGELRKADAWAISNSISRSSKGWQRTLNTWLSKEQDRAKSVKSNKGGAAPQGGKYDHLGKP